MTQTPPAPNPIDQKTIDWATYNARILAIRDKYYLDQQALRVTRDATIKTANDDYATALAKLQEQYNADITAARSAHAGQQTTFAR